MKIKNLLKIKNGFTLVEIIVVIAIIATISALSLFNSGKLNSAVLLSNTAYEVSLIIRDAQISGLGAKVLLDGNVATTSNQGVYFNINDSKIILFADLSKNNGYNQGEESQIYNIENKRAGSILSIKKIPNSGDPVDIQDLNIIFKRPNPEAYFYYTDTENNLLTEQYGSVAINMGFPGGDCKSIIVYKTGAIQIDKSFCQ